MTETDVRELIVKISGKVQKTNFKEFEESTLARIAEINTDLVTDEDFGEAEVTIKSCKLAEQRIAQAKQDGINDTADIAKLFATMEKLSDKIRDTRLSLEKIVKTEKSNRKATIIHKGTSRVDEALVTSPVAHSFHTDTNAIRDAVKGKRSIEKMQEAVDLVVESQLKELGEAETLFVSNCDSINEEMEEYHGLFPDWKILAVSSEEVVTATIESRINKFKLDVAEKKRKDEEKAKVGPVVEEPVHTTTPSGTTRVETSSYGATSSQGLNPDPVGQYVITIIINATKEKVIAAAKKVAELLKNEADVVSVNLSK